MGPDSCEYDVAIVGGGLAGLSAACELSGWDFVLLERGDRLGGRVLTRTHDGIPYDLGSCFGFEPDGLLPHHLPLPSTVDDSGPVGVLSMGRVFSGDTFQACFEQMGLRGAATAFRRSGGANLDALDPLAYRTIERSFQVIHPGNLREYHAGRRLDAFGAYSTKRHAGGNGAIVDLLAGRISRERIWLDAGVGCIDDNGHEVRLQVRRGRDEVRVRARVVICTVPGPVTLGLLARIDEASGRFLRSVRFGGGTVVVLGVDAELAKPMGMNVLVTPDLETTCIMEQQTSTPERYLVRIYHMNETTRAAADDDLSPAMRRTVEILSELYGPGLARAIRFFDAHRWDALGPRITEDTYGRWSAGALHPSPNVVLAGDYTFVDDRLMPYGMAPAVASGRLSAVRVKQLLDTGTTQP